jgi:hypothetical protein
MPGWYAEAVLIPSPDRVDTSNVDGGFNFGEPAKHPAKLGASRGTRTASPFDLRILWIATGLVVAGGLAFLFLRGAGEAGEQIADANAQTVAQIDRAQDAAAQLSATRAIVVARGVSAEQGTFVAEPAVLTAFDPTLRFTTGSSAGPASVAFSSTDSVFAVAVRSESGTCWWASTDAGGATTYGSGEACTGRAALAASAPSW